MYALILYDKSPLYSDYHVCCFSPSHWRRICWVRWHHTRGLGVWRAGSDDIHSEPGISGISQLLQSVSKKNKGGVYGKWKCKVLNSAWMLLERWKWNKRDINRAIISDMISVFNREFRGMREYEIVDLSDIDIFRPGRNGCHFAMTFSTAFTEWKLFYLD